ncbi:MAG TPA: CRISPR-associated endonuclease Cas2 [Longimicrobiales bacterium]|nr:CRISPR-associated endonuclease Cas2 [Longimicrobiales bacterium]
MTYDIADDKRRTKVFTMLFGYGDHAQYSVFFCELNQRELVQLRGRLREAINNQEDQVLLVDLGRAAQPLDAGLEVIGKSYSPLVRTVVI